MTHNSYHVVIFTDFTDHVLSVKALGAYKIAHELRKAGFSCLVVDHFSQWSWQDMSKLLSRVIGSNTLFVGFSTTFFKDTATTLNINGQITFTEFNANVSFCPQGKLFENQLVQKVKHINAQCKILLGGHKINEHCNNTNVDIVVTGLGELSMVQLAVDLQKNTQPIANSYKNISRILVVHKNQEKEYDFSQGGMEWQQTDVIGTRVLPLESARGCIFNCKFCNFPQRGKKKLDYVLAEELLFNELDQNYKKYGINTYQLLDDTFNDSDDKLDLIEGVVRQLSFQPVFWAYNRLDLLALRPHRIKKMFDIGVRATSFGIESLNQRTKSLIGKGYDPVKEVETIKQIRKQYGNNFLMHGLFIVGLPYESVESVTDTYNKIMSQEIPLHSTYFESLHIMKPGMTWLQSEFDKNWQSYGYTEISKTDTPFLNWKNDHMTFAQATELKQTFFQQIQKSDVMHIPGQTAWSLMNYSFFDLEKIQNTKNIDLPWEKITNEKIALIEQYQTSLFQHLKI